MIDDTGWLILTFLYDMQKKTNSACSDDDRFDITNNIDPVVFEKIYNQYWSKLYLAAYNVLRNRQAAEDIVQEVLVQLWFKKDNTKIANLGAFLYTAVRYKVLDAIRSGKVKQNFAQRIAEGPLCNDTEEQYREKELKGLLHQLVGSLPEKCREIFILSRNQQLTTKEIAHRLGITPKTVENQLTIALKRLKASMANYLCWCSWFLLLHLMSLMQ
jgi:RNA polymerase sigma-70 factor (family 1)